MIANHLNYEVTLGVNYVSEIQDRFLVRIESDVQVAVHGAMHGNHAAFYRGAGFNYAQPLRAIDIFP